MLNAYLMFTFCISFATFLNTSECESNQIKTCNFTVKVRKGVYSAQLKPYTHMFCNTSNVMHIDLFDIKQCFPARITEPHSQSSFQVLKILYEHKSYARRFGWISCTHSTNLLQKCKHTLFTSHNTRVAPYLENSKASCRPMPCAAPVTKMISPLIFFFGYGTINRNKECIYSHMIPSSRTITSTMNASILEVCDDQFILFLHKK